MDLRIISLRNAVITAVAGLLLLSGCAGLDLQTKPRVSLANLQVLEIRALEVREVFLGEGFGQLDLALAAAAAEDDRVSVRDATDGLIGMVDQYERVEGIICLA